MKPFPVAVAVLGAAAVLLCTVPGCSAQIKRQALIVGITGEWASDEGNQSNAGTRVSLAFLKSILVDENTCVYGTGGYLALQFDKDVTPVMCKRDTNAAGCHVTAKPLVCSARIQAPQAPADSTGYSLDTTFPFFHLKGAAERYVTPVSRGMDPELKDSVVELQDGKVDLTAAVEDLEPGSYKIRLEPLSGSGQSAAMNAIVNWQEGSRAAVAIPGLTAGLYRGLRLNTSGAGSGQDAWILISGPAQFAQDSAAYAAAAEATRKWPPEVDARAPQAVLRAYLDMLSRRQRKEPSQ